MKKNKVATPTFFIVTPSYNQATFLEKTITSVLEQDYPLIEYCVMDGGSTDASVSILKKYSKQIHWETKADKGQTDAINKGIAYFQSLPASKQEGAIFAYINSDDYYMPGAFEEVAAAFAAHPRSAWVVGEYTIESTQASWFHNSIVKTWKSFLKVIYSQSVLLVLNPIAQPATFIRWSAVKKTGKFTTKLRYVMDYEYWLRLQKAFGNPVFLDKILALFRIHQLSKGGSQYTKQFEEQYQVCRNYTQNKLLRGLHLLHNQVTLLLYQVFK